MTLTWYGLSSFKITATGDTVTVITDPFSKDSGLTPPRGAADLVVISRDESPYNEISGLTGEPLIVRNPGEFDVKGVHIQGIYDNFNPTNPTTIYQLEIDDIKIGFLGALNTRELSEQQLEELNGVDVLLIPIGGQDRVCSWEWASHIVQQVEPKFVVPCFFHQTGVKLKLDGPEKFLKELGGNVREEDRLTLKPKDLAQETTQVIVLKPQR